MNSTASGFYLLRLPSLPFAALKTGLATPEDPLRCLWETNLLAEAIFVASPGLFEQIETHIHTNGWPLPKPLHRSLYKYALRMSSRATPFGLMAGFCAGQFADSTCIKLADKQRLIRHRRLDMDCLAGLIRQLVQVPGIRSQLRFFPNNSYYVVGDELRYTERDDTGPSRHYFISAVPLTDYLEAILQRAESGVLIDELVAWLMTAGIAPDAATTFVDQLIDSQLLISELEPQLTGPPMLQLVRERLEQLKGTQLLVSELVGIEQTLGIVEADSRLVDQAVRQSINTCVGPLPVQHLIQTDLALNMSANQISHQVIQTITRQIDQLKPLNRSGAAPQLADFSRRFQERYGQQEIALQIALDSDYGIGYGDTAGDQAAYNPLLDKLSIPPADAPAQATWGPYEDLLLTKLSEALQGDRQAVELTDDELKSLGDSGAPIPGSFYLMGNLLSSSPEALEQGDFRFNLLAAEGPSAANLMGRFCAYSSRLTDQVRGCLLREEQQQPEVIFAEIVHWPDDRLGNILVRPALRTYEIPYISCASVAEDHQLPLSDLLVSVRSDGRVLLRSRRYGKEVIPRLSTAHNYRAGLSTYQFLADLQRQYGSIHLGWHWGLLQNRPFLPRITYKNLILQRARWTIQQNEVPTDSVGNLVAYLTATYRLPRWIAVAEGDNELVLDVHTTVGQQLLLEEIRRQKVIRLVEWIATPDQCWIQAEEGTYLNELIIPCEAQADSQATADAARWQPAPTAENDDALPRFFDPGSEWLYIKIYSGVQLADELLKTAIWPLVQTLKQEDVVQACFFIRYADPEPHIRLRFHSTTRLFSAVVFDRLRACLADHRKSGAVYRVQTDTYEREIERYGVASMIDSEHLFDADSLAIFRYLEHELTDEDRWHFAVQSCDALLNDFGLEIQQKVTLLRQLQTQFLAEHQADKVLRQQLNDRFRLEHPVITQLLSADRAVNTPVSDAILAERSATLQPLAGRIKSRVSTSQLLFLLASYLHMSLNRLFIAQQRTHELVIYHFLARYYESQQAKQRV